MTNDERQALDKNSAIADRLCGQPVRCNQGTELGRIESAAANKDGIVLRVRGNAGEIVVVKLEQ